MFISETQAAQTRATNQQYLQSCRNQPLEKVSALHESQLMQHYLREATVYDKILPPRDVSPADCEPGHQTDTLFKKVWYQPETRAFRGSFGGTPTEIQEVYAARDFIGFYMLSSAKIMVNDYKAAAYPFPIVEQIKQQIGPALAEAVDWTMHSMLEATIQAARGTWGNVLRGVQAAADIAVRGRVTSGGDAFRGRIQKDDFIAMKKFFAEKRCTIRRVLIPESDYLDFENLRWEDLGDTMSADVFLNGLSTDKITGVEIIRTIKQDVARGDMIRPGNIYGFAEPDHVGVSYLMQGQKFFADRDHQFLFFDANMVRGFQWMVASRICKIELYNGGLDVNGNVVAAYDGSTPGSDSVYTDPSQVTFKDYFDLDGAFQRPKIIFS